MGARLPQAVVEVGVPGAYLAQAAVEVGVGAHLAQGAVEVRVAQTGAADMPFRGASQTKPSVGFRPPPQLLSLIAVRTESDK